MSDTSWPAGAAHAATWCPRHQAAQHPEDEDGRWKLVDFGIAKSLDDTGNLTATGITIGSPSYLAPEQIQGDAATRRCDIWAMGVVLYESLAGHKPFRGDTPYALAEAVCTTEPTPLGTLRPDLDPGLLDVVTASVQAAEQLFASARDADASGARMRRRPGHSLADPDSTRVGRPWRLPRRHRHRHRGSTPSGHARRKRPVALWIRRCRHPILVLAAAAFAPPRGRRGNRRPPRPAVEHPAVGDDDARRHLAPETTAQTADTDRRPEPETPSLSDHRRTTPSGGAATTSTTTTTGAVVGHDRGPHGVGTRTPPVTTATATRRRG